MEFLRTPEECFHYLIDFPYKENWFELENPKGDNLRMHYLDEGPEEGLVVMFFHSAITWGFAYRKIIPELVDAGCRVIIPDFIGFGKSDKPADPDDYTFAQYVSWLESFIEKKALKNIVAVCHGWGGVIGLRLVADNPDTFSGAIAVNTMLLTGDLGATPSFKGAQKYFLEDEKFLIADIVDNGIAKKLSIEVRAGYDAPFPKEEFKKGARQSIQLLPTTITDPETKSNRIAWSKLQTWEKPFATIFGESDDFSSMDADLIMQKMIPGAKDQQHLKLKNAGHFLQEDCPEEFSKAILDFVNLMAHFIRV